MHAIGVDMTKSVEVETLTSSLVDSCGTMSRGMVPMVSPGSGL